MMDPEEPNIDLLIHEQIYGLLRALFATLGGVLITKGFADLDTVNALVVPLAQLVGGSLITIAVALWSYISKKKFLV